MGDHVKKIMTERHRIIELEAEIEKLRAAIKDARGELAHKKGGTAMEVYQILTRALA